MNFPKIKSEKVDKELLLLHVGKVRAKYKDAEIYDAIFDKEGKILAFSYSSLYYGASGCYTVSDEKIHEFEKPKIKGLFN